jgi:hypothetical protein
VFRLGCFGCLTVLIFLAAVGFAGWGIVQIARTPDIAAPPTTAADGLRAQQKIFDVLRRAGSGRPHSVTLSDREVNAFLSRHVADVADLPLRNLAVRLPSDGRAEIAGQIPLRQLLGDSTASAIGAVVPASWLVQPVWLSLRARVTLESSESRPDRRHLRLDPERFWLGRQRLPAVLLRLILDPTALRLLRWPMPPAIEGLRVEPGRLVIQTAS